MTNEEIRKSKAQAALQLWFWLIALGIAGGLVISRFINLF